MRQPRIIVMVVILVQPSMAEWHNNSGTVERPDGLVAPALLLLRSCLRARLAPSLSAPRAFLLPLRSFHTPTPPIARPRRIVGVSLKMYFDLPSTLSYVRGVLQLDSDAWNARTDLFVIPDFVSLTESARILESSSVMLGAQDTFWEDKGAYTGEVSPLVLRQAGARIVEIGHAERRAIFGETDDTVAKKAGAAARNGLIPLVCIGEKTHHSIASAAVGAAIQECTPQVTSVLAAVPDDSEVILAYEPVWAIGATEPADPDHVVMVTKELRKLSAGRKGTTRIVYGGSAGPGTFARIADGVDGLFLGRFAHDIHNLKKVIEEVGGA